MTKKEIEKRMTELADKAHNYIDFETLLYYGLPKTEVTEYFDLETKLNDIGD